MMNSSGFRKTRREVRGEVAPLYWQQIYENLNAWTHSVPRILQRREKVYISLPLMSIFPNTRNKYRIK